MDQSIKYIESSWNIIFWELVSEEMFTLKHFLEMKTTQTYSGLEPQGSATSKSAISEISSLYQRPKKGSNIEMQVKFLKKPEVIFKCSDSIA